MSYSCEKAILNAVPNASGAPETIVEAADDFSDASNDLFADTMSVLQAQQPLNAHREQESMYQWPQSDDEETVTGPTEELPDINPLPSKIDIFDHLYVSVETNMA